MGRVLVFKIGKCNLELAGFLLWHNVPMRLGDDEMFEHRIEPVSGRELKNFRFAQKLAPQEPLVVGIEVDRNVIL